MAWQTPKINWQGGTNSSGVYTGDRFNAEDFNRIKNNLEYLHKMAIALFPTFSIEELGSDRTAEDYFYADEINALENNLAAINDGTLNLDIGTAPVFNPNGSTMTFGDLNRLESATLNLYNKLNSAYNGRRMFTWNFGIKGGL